MSNKNCLAETDSKIQGDRQFIDELDGYYVV